MKRYTLRELIDLVVNFDNLYADYAEHPIGDVPAYLLTDPDKPMTGRKLTRHTSIYDDFTRRYIRTQDGNELTPIYPMDSDVTNDYLAYEATGHPGILNAIMDNADANLFITYQTGRVVPPAPGA